MSDVSSERKILRDEDEVRRGFELGLIVIPIPDVNGDGDSAFFGLGLGQFPSHKTEIDRFEGFEIEECRIFDSDDEAGLVDAFIRCHLWNNKRAFKN